MEEPERGFVLAVLGQGVDPNEELGELEELARARPNVQAHIDGHQVTKVVVVPSKLVNFVVR